MRRFFSSGGTQLPDQVYAELVRSLFSMLLPSVVMSGLFVGVSALAATATGDPCLEVLGAAGTIASVCRLAVVIACRRRGVEATIVDRGSAARHERLFGICYLAFACILGLFGGRAMALNHVGLHMVVGALLVGYAAGVAAGISLRPRVGGASMLLAVIPPALVCLWRLETFHVALAVVLLALLIGGLQSMQARFRAEVDKIAMRRAISGLARRDPLTELPNRLGFAERFDEVTSDRSADCLIAVHCLDLDRFKPVNDQYGHPVGDQLLRQVAGRLSGSLRQGDLAARFGGDEFVVLQSGVRHADEADLLARRISRALGEPYSVAGRTIGVGVSVGYAVSHCGEQLATLLARADETLYAVKAAGGGSAARNDVTVDVLSRTG